MLKGEYTGLGKISVCNTGASVLRQEGKSATGHPGFLPASKQTCPSNTQEVGIRGLPAFSSHCWGDWLDLGHVLA